MLQLVDLDQTVDNEIKYLDEQDNLQTMKGLESQGLFRKAVNDVVSHIPYSDTLAKIPMSLFQQSSQLATLKTYKEKNLLKITRDDGSVMKIQQQHQKLLKNNEYRVLCPDRESSVKIGIVDNNVTLQQLITLKDTDLVVQMFETPANAIMQIRVSEQISQLQFYINNLLIEQKTIKITYKDYRLIFIFNKDQEYFVYDFYNIQNKDNKEIIEKTELDKKKDEQLIIDQKHKTSIDNQQKAENENDKQDENSKNEKQLLDEEANELQQQFIFEKQVQEIYAQKRIVQPLLPYYLDDKIVVFKQDLLKLYIKEEHQMILDERLSQEEITSPEQEVLIKLKQQDVNQIMRHVKNLESEKQKKYWYYYNVVNYFYNALDVACTNRKKQNQINFQNLFNNWYEYKDYYFVTMQYSDLVTLIKQLYNLSNNYKYYDNYTNNRLNIIINTLYQQLMMLTNHEELLQYINNQFKNILIRKSSAEYNRLNSFISYEGHLNIYQLSNLGITNNRGQSNKMYYYNNQDIQIYNNNNVMKQIIDQVSLEQMLNENVDLGVNVNAMTGFKIDGYAKINKTTDNQYLQVLDSTGDVRVFYVGKWIKLLVRFNIMLNINNYNSVHESQVDCTYPFGKDNQQKQSEQQSEDYNEFIQQSHVFDTQIIKLQRKDQQCADLLSVQLFQNNLDGQYLLQIKRIGLNLAQFKKDYLTDKNNYIYQEVTLKQGQEYRDINNKVLSNNQNYIQVKELGVLYDKTKYQFTDQILQMVMKDYESIFKIGHYICNNDTFLLVLCEKEKKLMVDIILVDIDSDVNPYYNKDGIKIQKQCSIDLKVKQNVIDIYVINQIYMILVCDKMILIYDLKLLKQIEKMKLKEFVQQSQLINEQKMVLTDINNKYQLVYINIEKDDIFENQQKEEEVTIFDHLEFQLSDMKVVNSEVRYTTIDHNVFRIFYDNLEDRSIEFHNKHKTINFVHIVINRDFARNNQIFKQPLESYIVKENINRRQLFKNSEQQLNYKYIHKRVNQYDVLNYVDIFVNGKKVNNPQFLANTFECRSIKITNKQLFEEMKVTFYTNVTQNKEMKYDVNELISTLTNPDETYEQRENDVQLLNILYLRGFIDIKPDNSINLYDFIILNILKAKTVNFIFLQFLNYMDQKQLLSIIQKIVIQIVERKLMGVSQAGAEFLNNYLFQYNRYLHNYQQKMLNNIDYLISRQLKQSYYYETLQSKFNIKCLAFEKQIFSEQNMYFYNKDFDVDFDFKLEQQFRELKNICDYDFVVRISQNRMKVFLDLQQKRQIYKMFLRFCDFQYNDKVVIHVNSVNENGVKHIEYYYVYENIESEFEQKKLEYQLEDQDESEDSDTNELNHDEQHQIVIKNIEEHRFQLGKQRNFNYYKQMENKQNGGKQIVRKKKVKPIVVKKSIKKQQMRIKKRKMMVTWKKKSDKCKKRMKKSRLLYQGRMLRIYGLDINTQYLEIIITLKSKQEHDLKGTKIFPNIFAKNDGTNMTSYQNDYINGLVDKYKNARFRQNTDEDGYIYQAQITSLVKEQLYKFRLLNQNEINYFYVQKRYNKVYEEKASILYNKQKELMKKLDLMKGKSETASLFDLQNDIREIEKVQLMMLMIKQEQEQNSLSESNFLGYLRQLEKQMQQNLNVNYSSNGSDQSFLTSQNIKTQTSYNIKTQNSQNTVKTQKTKKTKK